MDIFKDNAPTADVKTIFNNGNSKESHIILL
jgi:hypothetical protein